MTAIIARQIAVGQPAKNSQTTAGKEDGIKNRKYKTRKEGHYGQGKREPAGKR
jgi:hypothetical protein